MTVLVRSSLDLVVACVGVEVDWQISITGQLADRDVYSVYVD